MVLENICSIWMTIMRAIYIPTIPIPLQLPVLPVRSRQLLDCSWTCLRLSKLQLHEAMLPPLLLPLYLPMPLCRFKRRTTICTLLVRRRLLEAIYPPLLLPLHLPMPLCRFKRQTTIRTLLVRRRLLEAIYPPLLLPLYLPMPLCRFKHQTTILVHHPLQQSLDQIRP